MTDNYPCQSPILGS